jgi:hypothetical protein
MYQQNILGIVRDKIRLYQIEQIKMDLILVLKYLKANSISMFDRRNAMTIKVNKSKNDDETTKP